MDDEFINLKLISNSQGYMVLAVKINNHLKEE
jgi:hypothetical protein